MFNGIRSLLCATTALLATASIHAQTTHIVNSDGSGDFTTISAAIAAAAPNDIIEIVGSGGGIGDAHDYQEYVRIDKSLTLVGIENPIITAPTTENHTTYAQNIVNRGVVEIVANDVTVDGLYIKVNAPYAGWGILASNQAATVGLPIPNLGTFNNARIQNNVLWPQIDPSYDVETNPDNITLFRVRGIRLSSSPSNVQRATMSNNLVTTVPTGGIDNRHAPITDPTTDDIVQMFGRGITVRYARTQLYNNDVTGSTQDVHFDFLNVFTVIHGNTFRFRGLELSGFNPRGDALVINNTFNQDFVFRNLPSTPAGSLFFADNALLIKGIYEQAGVYIEGNTFNVGSRGIYNTASRGAIVANNTFNVVDRPAGILIPEYIHIDFDRAWPGGSCCTGINLPDGGDIFVSANEFNGNDEVDGTAVRFAYLEPQNNAPVANNGLNEATTKICSNNFAANITTIVDNDPSTDIGSGQPTIPLSNNYYASASPVFVGSVDNDSPSATEINVALDSDLDGLSDAFELCFGTDPFLKDTSGDGLEDRTALVFAGAGFDPRVVNFYTDADNDGLPDDFGIDPDPTTPDADGDGYSDFYELLFGTDPLDPNSRPSIGDVTGSGSLELEDALDMFRVFLGLKERSELANPDAFDVNRDGVENNLDATIVINFVLGNIDVLPLPLKGNPTPTP